MLFRRQGRALDTGCGNGNLIIRALKIDLVENGGCEFVGMYFSRNMLGRAVYRAAGFPRAAFLTGNVTSLPFQDKSFDWVASRGVLTCFPSAESSVQALPEFNHVLTPGGVLAVDFFNRISHYALLRKHLFWESINPPEYV